MSRAFTDNINSFNVSNNIIFNAPDDESKILAWLSPLEPQVRHHDICNQRVNNIGGWLLETKEFRSWYNGSEKDGSDHAALFCYGDPGVGKSYIWYERLPARNKQRALLLTPCDDSSVVVDYLCDQAIGKDLAVVCFYYDFASREVQFPTNMLGSLVKQLLSGLGAVPVEIAQIFRGQRKVIGGRKLQLPDIVKMFATVASLQPTFICVDALDECVPKHRLEVLDALGQILQRSPNTRMFMTGRSHIRREVERGLGRTATSISIKPRDDDIVTYLRARLRKDTTPEVMNDGLEDDIIRSIPEEISESYVAAEDIGSLCNSCTNMRESRFLLVSLKVEAILSETTIHRRRNRLNAMEDGLGLGDAYEATLERIGAQGGEKAKLAMTTLMWVCYSERPLRVDELCHALAVEVGSSHFNIDNVPAIDTLLACCQGLVTVDKEASTVRLIHHTLREYLSTHRNLFPQAHSAMAETCLTYLDSDQANPKPCPSSMPFLKYCSRHWGTHAKRESSDRVILLAMELLDQFENHAAANSLFEQILDPDDSPEVNSPSLFSGLHCASFFGIVDLMTSLLGVSGCDPNQGDSAGIAPLIWAVRGGQEEAVGLLLGLEAVDPNKPNNVGVTPLWWAAKEGHESMVKQLLDREDINPNQADGAGFAPLFAAAIGGHRSVVKLLLDREDVNPNQPTEGGYAPLLGAALEGHEAVVKLLLDREDVNPNQQSTEGLTPIFAAAMKGHETVVRQLLNREDLNPDKPDNEGGTPLLVAATEGHESVVKQLLDREDVNPNQQDTDGYTPLFVAAAKGHESVVKRLLDRQDVNPNKPDNEGNTPLSLAAMGGHESVVKRLLEHEGVNPDKSDSEGKTPLSWAAINGHESVAKLFLDRQDVNPNKPDNEDKTPLSWAAMKGHESVVKQLLDRQDVNTDKPDNEGKTPLSWAAVEGHESVVKRLLDREDVSPDKPDNEGNTPLSLAAMGGHESVVKQILHWKDVNPGGPHESSHIPLPYVSTEGHEREPNLLQVWRPSTPVSFTFDEFLASLPSSSP